MLFAKDGTLNLTGLFKLPPSEEKPATEQSTSLSHCASAASPDRDGLPPEDPAPQQPVEFVYDSLNLELTNLGTLPDDWRRHADGRHRCAQRARRLAGPVSLIYV